MDPGKDQTQNTRRRKSSCLLETWPLTWSTAMCSDYRSKMAESTPESVLGCPWWLLSGGGHLHFYNREQFPDSQLFAIFASHRRQMPRSHGCFSPRDSRIFFFFFLSWCLSKRNLKFSISRVSVLRITWLVFTPLLPMAPLKMTDWQCILGKQAKGNWEFLGLDPK